MTIAAAAASIALFVNTFGGTWSCVVTVPATAAHPAQIFTSIWTIESPKGTNWTIVRYASPAGVLYGTAYVGFVPQLGAWVYDDFHADGALARVSSPGPVNSVWEWRGSYYPIGGSTDTSGDILWKSVSLLRFERQYRKIVNGEPQDMGRDVCTKR